MNPGRKRGMGEGAERAGPHLEAKVTHRKPEEQKVSFCPDFERL